MSSPDLSLYSSGNPSLKRKYVTTMHGLLFGDFSKNVNVGLPKDVALKRFDMVRISKLPCEWS